MKEFQDKERRKRYLYSPVVLLIFSVLVFFVARGAAGIMKKERESHSRVAELERESSELKARHQELEASIGRLETEEGIIDEIRNKFNVTRKGENVAIIVDDFGEKALNNEDLPWYKELWNAIIQRDE